MMKIENTVITFSNQKKCKGVSNVKNEQLIF